MQNRRLFLGLATMLTEEGLVIYESGINAWEDGGEINKR